MSSLRCGPGLVAINRGLFGREIVLDVAAVRCGRKAISWDVIDHYVYDWGDWSRPGDFVVVGRGGTTIRIAPFFDRFGEVADRFIEEAHERSSLHDAMRSAGDFASSFCTIASSDAGTLGGSGGGLSR